MRELDFLRVVIDETNVCSYLPQQTARMPLCLPTQAVTPDKLDALLAAGYRRSGWFFYKTRCPNCQACEPLRLEVTQFQASRSQRRALKTGDQNLQLRLAEPIVDEQRVRLFNLHRSARKLDHGNPLADESDYRSFLVNSYCQIAEISLWHNESLIAVSILDVGENSLSAVYCYFDPAASAFSPGTYAILKQIELARAKHYKWLYLGLYVAANLHLNYKARYRPHQRLLAGEWKDFSS